MYEAVRGLYWWTWLILGLTIAGCIKPQEVPCGDLLCPPDAVCTTTNALSETVNLCQFPDNIAACASKHDGTECTDRKDRVGICVQGACSAEGICGDGLQSAGEACDDGNRNDVDGCTSMCRRNQWQVENLVGSQINALDVAIASPDSVTSDENGNIYIIGVGSNLISRIDRNNFIATVAGTGDAGYSGDGGKATSARINSPSGMVVDGFGNLIFADALNHRVRQVDTNGIIKTIAGTGVVGLSGDGNFATSAQLNTPDGLALDGAGNLFIADRMNHRIRRVDRTGIITTIAGTTAGFVDGVAAVDAKLNQPRSIATDLFGNLYFVDTGNYRVRKIAANGIISTLAGDGNFSSLFPISIAVNRDDRVYIVDALADLLVLNVDGTTKTVAEGAFYSPSSVALDQVGSGLIVADRGNYRIAHVDTAEVVTTIAGTGSNRQVRDGNAAISEQFGQGGYDLSGIAFDSQGALLAVTGLGSRLRRIDKHGIITTVAGNGTSGFSGDGMLATNAQVAPLDVAVDKDDNIFIADTFNSRIRKVDRNGIITTVAGTGLDGFSGDGSAATSAMLHNPFGVAVDAVGNLFVADTSNNRVRRINTTGIITTIAGNGIEGLSGDGAEATGAKLAGPQSITFDRQGNLYIADSLNHRIRKVDTNGIITTVAGTLEGFAGDGLAATRCMLKYPSGVETDPAGNLYIADQGNARVRKVDAAGIISTLAGDGTFGEFSGDGGLAVDAILGVNSVSFHAGDLYISNGYERVRRVKQGIITTVVGGKQVAGIARSTRIPNVAALAIGGEDSMLLATGASGSVARLKTVDLATTAAPFIDQIAGRYQHERATGALARFQDRYFGSVGGVAWDAARNLIYLTESSPTSSRVWAVTPVVPDDPDTWTISALVNSAGNAGFADGAAATARLQNPTGLWLDANTLYIADTGNHAIRAMDLVSKSISTIVNGKHLIGFSGDGGAALNAKLYQPQAFTKCANGDLFIADTGNNRVRRIEANTQLISTVLGDGLPASSGQGSPATTFPVDTPMGITCDAANNLFVSSSTTVRLLPASTSGIVDGSGPVQSIYGAGSPTEFPASETSCLTGIIAPTNSTIRVADSCSGLVVGLTRTAIK